MPSRRTRTHQDTIKHPASSMPGFSLARIKDDLRRNQPPTTRETTANKAIPEFIGRLVVVPAFSDALHMLNEIINPTALLSNKRDAPYVNLVEQANMQRKNYKGKDDQIRVGNHSLLDIGRSPIFSAHRHARGQFSFLAEITDGYETLLAEADTFNRLANPSLYSSWRPNPLRLKIAQIHFAEGAPHPLVVNQLTDICETLSQALPTKLQLSLPAIQY